ncbi:MAG: hypothetical protein E6H09_22625 [Bacteroidetes bacterium]|nr:MAG: hypothetical protein E6H09_22625 [Bacteroidota bacterium]
MARYQPFEIIGYHSCDKDVGLNVLTGKTDLLSSNNDWDWLGDGVYFWEQDPKRALHYAVEVANGKQFNKTGIKTPFILGAVVQLGNCLNLVESESLNLLKDAHYGLAKVYGDLNKEMPVNKGANRKLDCAVIRFIHQTSRHSKLPEYDTIRSAFDEGEKVYEGANFTTHHHIQVSVINRSLINGYFLPRPLEEFNPYLFNDYKQT